MAVTMCAARMKVEFYSLEESVGYYLVHVVYVRSRESSLQQQYVRVASGRGSSPQAQGAGRKRHACTQESLYLSP